MSLRSVRCERFVRCNPHLALSSFVQSSPGRGSRGPLATRHPWQPGHAVAATSLGMTPDLGGVVWRTERGPQSYKRHREEPPGGGERQCCLVLGSATWTLGLAGQNAPNGRALLRNPNYPRTPLNEPRGPGQIPHRTRGGVCCCPLRSQPCRRGLRLPLRHFPKQSQTTLFHALLFCG